MNQVVLHEGDILSVPITVTTLIQYGDIDELAIEKDAIRELRGRLAEVLECIIHAERELN